MSPRTPKPSGRQARGNPRFDTTTDLRRRASGTRAERKSFLLLCEGKTEKLYFTGLRTRRGPQLDIDIPGCDHRGVVEIAIHRRTDEYDEVWCVLDTELDNGLVSDLIERAEAGGVELALSSPCFEVWLVLHHRECSAPFQTAKHAKRMLMQVLPAWSEAHTQYADFKDDVQAACDRARRMNGEGGDPTHNPYTDVWRLVVRILESGGGANRRPAGT